MSTPQNVLLLSYSYKTGSGIVDGSFIGIWGSGNYMLIIWRKENIPVEQNVGQTFYNLWKHLPRVWK